MKITEHRTKELLHWLDDTAADRTLLFEEMTMYRDAAALIRQQQAAEQAAWHAGLDAGREQGKGNEHCRAEPQPAGVETVDAAAWIEVLELPEGFRVAEHLPGIWEYQFDIEDEADEDSDRKVSGTSWNHPALAAIAAWGHAYDTLAQQPAAVDEEVLAAAERAWDATANGIGRFQVGSNWNDCLRAALTAALAWQPGGSDNDR